MKSTLFVLFVSVLVLALASEALAAGKCALNTACNGPVKQTWSSSSSCSGTPSYSSINSGMIKSGDCFSVTQGGVSASARVSCGTTFTQKTYYTPDCSGQYTLSVIGTNKCVKGDGSSFKVQCAGANSVTFSVLGLCLVALLSLLAL